MTRSPRCLNSANLDALVAVIDAGSYTVGARLLHITRSALSKQIRTLEDGLGVQLLDREEAPVRATEAGRVLYAYVVRKRVQEQELFESLACPKRPRGACIKHALDLIDQAQRIFKANLEI